MSPIFRLVAFAFRSKDWPTLALLSLIVVTGIWTALLPIVPTVQRLACQRFHLQTRPFASWAALQIVPAMYNLENSFTFTTDQALDDKQAAYAANSQLNHFPFRVVTFSDGRFHLFYERTGNACVEVKSRYQRQILTTRWDIRRTPDNRLVVSSVQSHFDSYP